MMNNGKPLDVSVNDFSRHFTPLLHYYVVDARPRLVPVSVMYYLLTAVAGWCQVLFVCLTNIFFLFPQEKGCVESGPTFTLKNEFCPQKRHDDGAYHLSVSRSFL